MKRVSTIFLVLFFAKFLNAQERLRIGLEFNGNTTVKYSYQRTGLSCLNIFMLYGKFELYSGFDVSNINYAIRRTWGFESGAKYHFIPKIRKSNLFIDLNYQYTRYADGCVGPVNPVRDPALYDCEYMSQIKSRLISVCPGYEMFYRNWLSTSLSLGPGINTAKIYALPNAVGHMFKGENHDAQFTFLLKASVRFTF